MGIRRANRWWLPALATGSLLATLVVTVAASADSPGVATGPASSIGSTSATVSGSVQTSGASTLVVFQYGTATTLGSSTLASPQTGGPAGSVVAVLTGLQPQTTYFYRVATITGQTVTPGSTLSFTTAPGGGTSGVTPPSGTTSPGGGGGPTPPGSPGSPPAAPGPTPGPGTPPPAPGNPPPGGAAPGAPASPAPGPSQPAPPQPSVNSPSGQGYWVATTAGEVFSYGGAPLYGSAANVPLAHPIVGMAATPDGQGYWLVASDGEVFPYGDASYFGSPANGRLIPNIVGLTPTPDGQGYWLIASDGGLFTYGDAVYYGSPSDLALTSPVVAMAATPDGQGYWVTTSDGGVFPYGDALSYGSAAPLHPTHPITAMSPSPDGRGYWLVASDGAVFAFGDATFQGAANNTPFPMAVSAVAATPDGQGYWLAAPSGGVVNLGDAPTYPALALPLPHQVVAIVVPFRHALADVPMQYVVLAHQAASTCPGMSWTVLAAIAKVESDFGRSPLPGVWSGTNPWGAAGPMQMGIDGAAGHTFQAYSHPVPKDRSPTPTPPGANPQNPWDPTDAVYAAARDLCTNGAGNPSTLNDAILAYNHAQWYATEVEALAAQYGGGDSSTLAAAAQLALSQVGVPYKWGGTSPSQGFDCSGLVQWAYSLSGIELPRTSQSQWAALPHLPAGVPLVMGDLVFFGPADGPTHVGIYIGNGFMVDAPHTGADVRVEPYNWSDYLGAAVP